MTDAAICPDRQALERLLRGLSTEDETCRLEQHLLECPSCCQATGEMEVSDTLLDAVREVAAADDLPDDEKVREVMERLKDLRPPASPAESETLASSGASTEDAWGLEQLLDPPQAEGKLGRFAGYRVLRVLGAGGMGLVLEAEDPQLRRRVALKVMKRPLAAQDEHHQRFLREARAAAAIEHAHIVTVHQVGEHRGLPFLAMQLLKGESLDDRLRRGKEDGLLPSPSSTEGDGRDGGTKDGLGRPSSLRGALPLAECLRIGRETAEALAEAHQRGLIHRDIKPGNIWLEAPRGWVKLVDFGLAHAAEDVHLTQTGAILGTPAYMSPEQARGEGVDARTDLYSLGAVLYKLTTGDVPFRGASTMAVLMALATETPKPPHEINPDVPPALSDLIVRLLAKKPDERLESAEAVAEAIGAIEQQSLKSEVQSPKSSEGRRRQRPRWPLVAAAAAALFLLAAIVVIVRDKDGNEVARLSVPEGGSVATKEGNVGPALRDGSASPMPEGRPASPPRSVGATLPEPPPFDEWLKGREILTVAQDGSGQFKTIQAALDALKPHQVVKVLDRGPYRERLQCSLVPADSGLISEQQTVLELSEWEKNGNGGHVFFDLQGFRLSGFVLAFPEDKAGGWGIYAQPPNGLVVENCLVRAPANCQFSAVVASWISDDGPTQPLVVRDCLFEGSLYINARNKHAAALVERCFFNGSPVRDHIVCGGPAYVVRHNVFAGRPGNASLGVGALTELLEISHNTLLPAAPMKLPLDSGLAVRVCNNLRTNPGLVIMGGQWANIDPEVLKAWDVARNCYPRQLEQGELGLAKRNILPTAATDLIAAPQFLSTDPTSRDYLRISADSPAAKITDENGRADYAGALPPGPAPKEGDWFTRLQERARQTNDMAEGSAQMADLPPPVDVPEPPPLEEWLKGRELLTVAQDGSGQFKTIQAALDALKPHQVVKVLDRGPYREFIRLSDPPEDIGLVSDEQTVLEISAWRLDGGGAETFVGIHILGADGFRLHGFAVLHEKRTAGMCTPISFGNCADVVVEQCVLRDVASAFDPRAGYAPSLAFAWWDGSGKSGPVCVRDSATDGTLRLAEGGKNTSTLLARNYFTQRRPADSISLWVSGRRAALVMRDNIIDTRGWGLKCDWHPEAETPFVLSNNTVLARKNLLVAHAKVNAVICNNLFESGCGLPVDNTDRLLPALLKTWQFGPNAYLAEPRPDQLPRQKHDIKVPLEVLSREFASRDYARPLPNRPLATAGAGGAWPSYLGALPPGPAPQEGDWFTRLQDRWQATWTPRTIAQWVMDRGGRIQFTLGTDLAKAEDAAANGKRFWVYFEGVKDFGDDDVAVMTQWGLYECEPNLMGTAMTDVGLRWLAALNLRAGLNAWGCPITGEGFDAFKGKTIGTVVLHECKLTEAGWRRLSETGEIRSAFLANTDMSDADLAIYLAGHPETDALGLTGNPLSDKAVELLTHRKQWDWLDLSDTAITDASVPLLGKLEQIKSLNISRTKVTVAGVAALRTALPDCKIGWNGPTPTDWTPRTIAQWVMARGGRIQFTHGTDLAKAEDAPADGKRFWVYFDELKDVGDDDVAVMTEWRAYECQPSFTRTALTDVGLRRLASLNIIPVGGGLGVRGCPITGEGFDAFKGKNIGTVVLQECKLTEAGWHRLSETGEIKIAYFSSTDMSDADLAIYLAGHPESQALELSGNPLTDKAVELLTRRKHWHWLGLSKTQITDAAVPLLGKLEQIGGLDISGTKLTAAGVAALRKALPDCKIGWNGPTPTTWTPRTIAQWVMDRGGRIQFNYSNVDLAAAEDAPADGKHFVVFFNGKGFGDDDAAVMTQWKDYELKPNFHNTALTDVGLRRLASLKLLGGGAGLVVYKCPITGEGFDAFKGRDFGTLVLNECKLTEAGWHRLAETGHIGNASLARTDMSDADLAVYLAGHPETETLDAGGNPLTDKAAELLAHRKQWTWLGLNETGITDAAVPLLAKLEQIGSLEIKKTEVTAAGVAALRKALPDCKIEWEDAVKVTAPARPITTFNEPAFQQWVKDVAALPAEKQVDAVAKKLQELNPGFDGKVTGWDGETPPRIENGVVTDFRFLTDNVIDISPVRALAGLKSLDCSGTGGGLNMFFDLSPLKGLPLTDLRFTATPVSNLSPLEGMPITMLNCSGTKVSDLSPLKRMKVTNLGCGGTQVTDLSPLRGLPLWRLVCGETQVSDLSPLEGMPLKYLHCDGAPIADLSHLKGMKLAELSCSDTRVSDLSPLDGMSLALLVITPKNITRGMDVIRGMKGLKTIGTGWDDQDKFPPEAFWKKYDAGEFDK